MGVEKDEPRTGRKPAVPAAEAQEQVFEALDGETRGRIERVRAFADEIRQAIRGLRKDAHGLKQSELAERLGVSTSTISRLESGKGLAGLDLEVALLAFAELQAAPMLTLLDPNSPGAGQVIDLTTWSERVSGAGAGSEAGSDTVVSAAARVENEPLAASVKQTQSGEQTQWPAVAYGLQSELKAVRSEISRLSDRVAHLSDGSR